MKGDGEMWDEMQWNEKVKAVGKGGTCTKTVDPRVGLKTHSAVPKGRRLSDPVPISYCQSPATHKCEQPQLR